ncbi:MAG TPA: substrate-binding domain-containing protein [Thermoplasmata archaeon]|nr:substrate-binding domain-containing protein [Thermoplasmata archaeon]
MSSPPHPPAAPSPTVDSPPRPTPRLVRRSGRAGLYTIVGIVVVVVVLVGAGLETHWYGLSPAAKPVPPGDCPVDVTISGAGASFLTPLLSSWETNYATYSSNRVTYSPVGAGTGIGDYEAKTVNFAATDEPLTGAEIKNLPGTTLTLPVSGGAVTVVYNIPGFSGTLNLSGVQIADIYLGTVTTWDSPTLTANNPGLSGLGASIIPIVRSDAAGTSYVLTNYLSDDDATFASEVGVSIQPAWPSVSGEDAVSGNSGLAKYVAANDNTIGYVDLADAESYDSGGIASVGNPADEYVFPNVTDTQSAIDALAGQTIPDATGNWSAVSWVNAPGAGNYPLAALQYFMVLQDPAGGVNPSVNNTQVLIQWLHWALTTGQSATAPLDYAVPPAALIAQDLAALSTINYNGAPLPACTTVG